MIRDDRDLISRRDFYGMIVRRLACKEGIFNATIGLREVLEIFEQMPTQEELAAEWIKDGNNWKCSYCMMHALESFGKSHPSKRCPYCGRRMKVREQNASTKR